MRNKQILFNYGLLGGGVVVAGFFVSMWILGTDPAEMDFSQGQLIGYAVMLLAMSSVFFGVKAYRDRHRSGLISFKDAFLNGMIVVMVASILYVVGWMIYYPTFMPDFADQYLEFQKETLSEKGVSGEAYDRQIAQLENFNEAYKKPLVMAGVTFMEIFPVGLLVALISAFILKRTSLNI